MPGKTNKKFTIFFTTIEVASFDWSNITFTRAYTSFININHNMPTQQLWNSLKKEEEKNSIAVKRICKKIVSLDILDRKERKMVNFNNLTIILTTRHLSGCY